MCSIALWAAAAVKSLIITKLYQIVATCLELDLLIRSYLPAEALESLFPVHFHSLYTNSLILIYCMLYKRLILKALI